MPSCQGARPAVGKKGGGGGGVCKNRVLQISIRTIPLLPCFSKSASLGHELMVSMLSIFSITTAGVLLNVLLQQFVCLCCILGLGSEPDLCTGIGSVAGLTQVHTLHIVPSGSAAAMLKL